MKINKPLVFALLLGFCTHELMAAKMMNPAKRQEQKIIYGPKIRALIAKEMNSAVLEAKGAYKVLMGGTNSLLSSGTSGKRFVVHGMREGLRWGEEYPDCFQIYVVPESENTTFFLDGIQYKGAMIVTQGSNYKITVVNEVAIEDFIKSTLAVKLNSAASLETLAALAITARTESYYHATKENKAKRLWDIDALDYNYFGHAISTRSSILDEAIASTRFMVMKKSVPESEHAIPFAVEWSMNQEGSSLSLAGAEELASRGYDAKKILKTYFPQANIVTTIEPAPVFLR